MNPIKNKSDISGLFGEIISVRKINGQIVIKNRPKRKVVAALTQKQNAVIGKFKEAIDWAKQQMKNPDVKRLYAEKITVKLRSAFIVALTDYLRAPVVGPIDTDAYMGAIGSAISAKVTDDFMVTEVSVMIRDAAGQIIEQGLAVQDPNKSFNWKYTATVANASLPGTRISVTGYDRPGNKAVLETVL